jgi:hypothetical protein
MPLSTPPASAPPPTFIGLVFSLSGWALVETTLLLQHAGLQAHLIPALMTLYLASYSTRRLKLRQQCLPGEGALPAAQESSPAALHIGWALLLLMLGALTGVLVLSNNWIFLGIVATVLTVAPWHRVPFYRDRIIVSSVLMCAGMVLPLLADHRSITPIFLLISAWVFWICAVFAVLNRMLQLRQAERMVRAASGNKATHPACNV